MTPTTSLEWWQLYTQNARAIAWCADVTGVEFDPWAPLVTMDGPALVRKLNEIWWAVPDRPAIHKWPGWYALCDLCSESEVLYACSIIPALKAIELGPTEAQSKKLEALRQRGLIRPGAIVAGGWVRDLLAGDEPKDIDVFATPDVAREIVSELERHSESPEKVEFFDEFTSDRIAVDPNCPYSEGLIATIGDIQVINVQGGDPRAYVRAFDATCNMLYVDCQGVWSIGYKAAEDASSKRYEQNPLSATTLEKFLHRAASRVALGWEADPMPNFKSCCRDEKRVNGTCYNCGDPCL